MTIVESLKAESSVWRRVHVKLNGAAACISEAGATSVLCMLASGRGRARSESLANRARCSRADAAKREIRRSLHRGKGTGCEVSRAT